MRPFRAWCIRLVGMFRSRDGERDLHDELESHLQLHVADGIRSGLTPEEARRQAILALGGLDQTKERWREQRTLPIIEQSLQDTVYAVRRLSRRPGLSVAAILGLGLAIGVATATFAVIYGVLGRAAPVRASRDLVSLFGTAPQLDRWREPVSGPRFTAWRGHADVFADMAAATRVAVPLIVNGIAERAEGELVSTNFFDVLGSRTLLGRTFHPGEGNHPIDGIPCIISERLWRTRFAGEPGVLGETVAVRETVLTIVGVLPEDVARWRSAVNASDQPFAVWIPYDRVPALLSPDILNSDGYRMLHVIGRLAAGITVEQARAAMTALDARIDEALGETESDRGIAMVPIHELMADSTARRALWLVAWAVLLVLALACANLTSQLVAEAVHREREFSTRRALGASSRRLVRQVIVESALLTGTAGVVGGVIATWAAGAFTAFAPPAVARHIDLSVDWPSYAFAALITVAATFGVALLPALRVATARTPEQLREVPGPTAAPRGLRWQRLLVAGQTATIVPLAATAVLLVTSFVRLNTVDTGLAEPQRVLTMRLDAPESRRGKADSLRSLQEAVLDGTLTVPGIQTVAIATAAPVDYLHPNPRNAGVSITIEGARRFLNGDARDAVFTPTRRVVTPDYFRVLGLRIVAGRAFTAEDRAGTERVALVNETMARMHWPGENPVGRRVNFETVRPGRPLQEPWTVVIGVVADARQYRYDAAPRPEIYTPLGQAASVPDSWTLVARSAVPASTVANSVTEALAGIDPAMPVYHVRTLDGILTEATATPRYLATVVGLFAVPAVLLAALGVHGLVAYAAAQRVREMAIRVALGGTRADVERMALRQGIGPAAAGLVIGAVIAFWARRFVGSLLYETDAADPVLFGAAMVGLLLVAATAAYLPARRAAGVDPLVVLRAE